jgi:putative hemolysin
MKEESFTMESDPEAANILFQITILVILTLINAFFAGSEMAVVSVNKNKIHRLSEQGNKNAALIERLMKDSTVFLSTIQVAITLVGFFASAAAATNLSDPLAQWLSGFNIGWLSVIAPGLAPVVITLIVSYLSIVVGELVPKRIALADAERVSKMVAGPLMVFQKIASPLVALTSASANGLSRLFGIKNADERQNVSEEEIKYMVTDNDELLEDEKRMIHDILDLGDMTVHEIMTPRVDVMFAEDTDTVRQTVERMRGTGYSRLPVYHEDIDRIVGIVHFKDLVAPLMDGKEHEPVAEYAYEAMFVPETKDLFPLLAEMQTNRQQMAIVVDEYGGTDGLITVEDIVEEVVGEIVDETDRENPFIEQESENVWVVDGRFPVEDAAELGWPVEDSADYETIAGWLMSMLDSVPQVGEELAFDGYRFKIQAMRRRRISTVRVERLDDPSPSCVDAVEAIDREEA